MRNKERRSSPKTNTRNKQLIRVNADKSVNQPIWAAGPARAAAKACQGPHDSETFLLVEINEDRQPRQRGTGVHKYSVAFRQLRQNEITDDRFRNGTSIRQRKISKRYDPDEWDVQLGLEVRDRIELRAPLAPTAAPAAGGGPPPAPINEPRVRSAWIRNERSNPFPSVGDV